MLAALTKEGKLTNTVTDQLSKVDGPFTCPGCGAHVRLKQGSILQAHFAHVSRKACQFFSENESTEHLTLKGQLYTWAKKDTACQVRLEQCLPEIQQIADLFLKGRLALEVQCSRLSLERLKERTSAYHEAGYEVIWLLGKKLWLEDRLNSLQKQLLSFSQNRGFYLWEADSDKNELRLKYLIHEDWHGKVQYLTQTFKMGEQGLLACLRKPFVAQKLCSFQAQIDHDICTYVAKQLHYRHPKWLKQQETLYAQGGNLLTWKPSDFYPQVRPISSTAFSQIRVDLTSYYQDFWDYYQKVADKSVQILYSPAFYDKIKKKEETINGKKQTRHR